MRLAREPRIRSALGAALDRGEINVGASRRTSGNRRVYEELERELAGFFEVEAAVLVSSGYVTSLVAAQALAGSYTQVLLDARAHAALVDAAKFLEAPVERFRHRDATDLARRLKRAGGASRPIVLTDGMFAHDGSVAPLRAYARVLPRGRCLLVDDAHGAGILGAHGRGAAELEGVEEGRLIRTITLSKAFGVYGGAILGSGDLREQVLRRSRLFIGNTPLPPVLAEGARAAIRFLRRRPGLRRRLRENTVFLRGLLRQGGVDVPEHPGPVIGIRPVADRAKEVVDAALLSRGVLPPFMVYPGGAEGGYYRFAISVAHRPEELRRVAEALLSCREQWV